MGADSRPCPLAGLDLRAQVTPGPTQEETLASGAYPGLEGKGNHSRVCEKHGEEAGVLHLGTNPWEQSGRAAGRKQETPVAAFTRPRGCRLRAGVGLPRTRPKGPSRSNVTQKPAGHTHEGDQHLVKDTLKVDSRVFKERRAATPRAWGRETGASNAQVILFRF